MNGPHFTLFMLNFLLFDALAELRAAAEAVNVGTVLLMGADLSRHKVQVVWRSVRTE